MPVTQADYDKYSRCRHCGSEDLDLRSHKPGWRPKLKQSYYFTHWFTCQECGTYYLLESCKRSVDQQAFGPIQTDLFPP